MINLLLVNNFYPALSYRRVQKKKKATNYCIHGSVTRYGPRTTCQELVEEERVNQMFLLYWLQAGLLSQRLVIETNQLHALDVISIVKCNISAILN